MLKFTLFLPFLLQTLATDAEILPVKERLLAPVVAHALATARAEEEEIKRLKEEVLL